MSSNLWAKWFRQRSSRLGTSCRRTARPCLEVLEERLTPSVVTINVNDNKDQLDNPANVTVAQLGSQVSLRDAINAANNSGGGNSYVINLQANTTYDLTAVDNNWYGPNGLPPITSNLTINGNGATIARDSNPADNTPDFRLFYVSGGLELPAGSLTMDNVTLQNGIAQGGNSNLGGGGLGAGGAIFNQGTINLTDVTLTNNEALGGSSGNTAAGNGGGGMGQDAPTTGAGGGFGGSLAGGPFGGTGGGPSIGGGGGGGGFITGANGTAGSPNPTSQVAGVGGGLGGFGQGGNDGGDGGAGTGEKLDPSGAGGAFGSGGNTGTGLSGGGGGGVGGGGASGNEQGGFGGFGGGGGASDAEQKVAGGVGGFGAGGAGTSTTITGGTPGAGGAGGFGGGAGTAGGIGGSGAGMGGAIFNMGANGSAGQATLVNCTLTANVAKDGSASGGNGGSALGGAIFNLDGSVTLTNDTLDANTAGDGGAVYNLAFGNDINTGKPVTAALVLNNSILADSHLPLTRGLTPPGDLASFAVNGAGTNTATVTGSHNLVATSQGTIGAGVITQTASPNLGPLQNNGGLTPTMLPQAGSAALGAGDPSLAPPTDQRGLLRPPNGPTDLGSVQVTDATTPPPPGSTTGSTTGSTSSPPAPSLISAIFGLFIAEAEKDLGFGNPAALQQTIDFDAQFTVIFGINIAPLIEQLADSDVGAARGGS